MRASVRIPCWWRRFRDHSRRAAGVARGGAFGTAGRGGIPQAEGPGARRPEGRKLEGFRLEGLRALGGGCLVEIVTKKHMMLFSGTAHPQLAEEIATELGIRTSSCKIRRFASGEIYVRSEESVRGADV